MSDNVYIVDCKCGNCKYLDFLKENLRSPFLCTASRYNWRPLPRHVPINFASQCPNFGKTFSVIQRELRLGKKLLQSNQAKNAAVEKWVLRCCKTYDHD